MQVNVCVEAPLTEGISKWELIANIPNPVDIPVPTGAYWCLLMHKKYWAHTTGS
jgi:hypothetical protein